MVVGNLEFIKSETITTSVSSIDITDIFSNKYDNYCIVFYTVASTANALRGNLLDTSGTLLNGVHYDNAMLNMLDSTGFTESRTSGDTRWERVSIHSPTGQNATMFVFNPYNASSYTFVMTQGSTYYGAAGIGAYGQKQIGVYKQTSSVGGIRFTTAAGTLDSGKISVYGLASN